MSDEIQDWGPIEVDENEFVLLPEGRYPFAVTKLERTRSKDGVPMAKVSLRVDGGASGSTTVIENIKLIKSTDWKKAQLFSSIGTPSVNGKVAVDWDALDMGIAAGTANGVADFEVNEYAKDGKSYRNNKVSAFLPHGTPAAGSACAPVEKAF